MPIPKNVVDKSHILKALAAIDQDGVPWHRQSTKFDLLYDGKKYPPKYAVSLAFGFATGKELHGFTGGEETNSFLKSLGFEITEKIEGAYLLLRSNEESPWKDEHGASYHYGSTVPNNKRVQPGVRFLVDRRFDGGKKIVGIGEIGEVVEEAPSEKGKQYRASFSQYKTLLPPRIVTAEIESRIASLPNYNQQHSIRVINAELFQELSEPARAWLFQGNPDRYDIAGALRELKEVSWAVNQHKDEIHEGDRVYYWQAGSAGGIVGVGDILDEPQVRPPLESELKFYRDDAFRQESQEYLGVLIRREKFVEPPIGRQQVRAVRDLANLTIFQQAAGTNFPVTETQAEAIEKLLAGVSRRYWKIAPGEKASIWSHCVGDAQSGCIRIGWPTLGDLSRFSVEDDLRQAFENDYQKGRKWRELWEFLHIREGDVILANNGMTSIVGVGTVTKPYFFDSGLPDYPNCLGVKWWDVQDRPIPEGAKSLVKDWFGYTVKELTAEEFERLTTTGKAPMDRYAEVCAQTFLPAQFFQDCEHLLDTQKQIILQGAPGTGKTFVGEQLALLWAGSVDRVKVVQFHESYGYEDFVFGLKPRVDPETKKTAFYPEPGTLLRFCEQVGKAGDQRHVLLIDEINRAKTARVFGELLYLLEYRDREVELQNGTSFSIPKNLFIIGTMNTTDKSIALVDYALRRRFAFVDLVPVKDGHSVVLSHWLRKHQIMNADEIERLFVALNQSIAQKDDALMIGHSYFMREEAIKEKQFSPELLSFIWQYYIIPLIAEYEYQLRKDELEKRYGLDTIRALAKAQALTA
jgi:5-methylcytosine-specific restriction enzyme B